MRRPLIALWLSLLFALPVRAGYNETADAKAEIRHALAQAAEAHQSVLVVFGANWCPDCRVLDAALTQGPSAPLVAKAFKVVKVDIGQYDRNLDIAESYGVTLKKGIPTVAILSAGGKVSYVTRDSELADARHMGDNGIYRFFKEVTAKPCER